MRPHGRGGLMLACRLLPRDVRADVFALYGVFRTLDDLVDDGRPDATARVAAVEGWARSGVVGSPEAAALADLGRRHPIPPEAIADFCAGMRADLRREPIRTEAELDLYCYRVAGTVAVVVTSILGASAPCWDAARSLGIAMQRTNIVRDIDEDRAAGRVYIAEETLARHGSLLPGERGDLLLDQIARADELYERGIAGVPALRRGRAAVLAAAATYREILRQMEREGLGAASGRAVVSPARKVLVAGRLVAAELARGRLAATTRG